MRARVCVWTKLWLKTENQPLQKITYYISRVHNLEWRRMGWADITLESLSFLNLLWCAKTRKTKLFFLSSSWNLQNCWKFQQHIDDRSKRFFRLILLRWFAVAKRKNYFHFTIEWIMAVWNVKVPFNFFRKHLKNVRRWAVRCVSCHRRNETMWNVSPPEI